MFQNENRNSEFPDWLKQMNDSYKEPIMFYHHVICTTGMTSVRTAIFSKIHIKFNFDRRKKNTPDLKRSRTKEYQKNAKKILKLF